MMRVSINEASVANSLRSKDLIVWYYEFGLLYARDRPSMARSPDRIELIDLCSVPSLRFSPSFKFVLYANSILSAATVEIEEYFRGTHLVIFKFTVVLNLTREFGQA